MERTKPRDGVGRSDDDDRRWQVFEWVGETLSDPGAWATPPGGWKEALEYVPGDVLPMLAHRLDEARAPLPDEVEEQLKQVRRAAAMRGIMVRRALTAVDACLDAEGIRCIWLKGAALRSQIYPDPFLRPMEDLDVCVPAELLPAAAAAAGSIGYLEERYVRVAEEASGHPKARLISRSFPRVPLEIHGVPHSLQGLPPAFVQGMWERAVPLDGTRGAALSPTDTILHLCLHLSRHHRFALGLRPLLDISLAVSRWKEVIDWPTWCNEVHGAGASASVWLPLRLSASIFRADVPVYVMDSLRPESSAHSLLALARDQFEDTLELPGFLERLVGGQPAGASLGGASMWWRAARHLPNKVRHYAARIRFGQIPMTGWRRITRLARGRRRLSDALRDVDGMGPTEDGSE